MSTPSITTQSLSTVSRRTMAILAAAVAAVALALVVLALNSGTTQPTTNVVRAAPVTPAQNIGTLNYGHSFAPAGNYTVQSAGAAAVNTPFAGRR